jgi:hypothetical protein
MAEKPPTQSLLQRELEQLAPLRDELRVQARLARAEIAEELEQLEERWLHLQDEVKRAAQQSQLRQEIEKKARGVVDELRRSYERIRQELTM